MKKTLLFISAMAAASSAFAFGNQAAGIVSSEKYEAGPLAPAIEIPAATRASGSIDFSYADDPYTAYSLSNVVKARSRFCLLFEMSADDIKAYAGSKVTGFSVYSPTNGRSNTITGARFFHTTDLATEEYTQDFSMSRTGFDLNEVAMDTPYTITGEEKNLYFGYSFIIPAANNLYYIPVDGKANDYPGSLIFGYDADGNFPTEFDYTAAAEIGALCMAIKIEGDNLPENIGSIPSFNTPAYLPISGDGVNVDFVVKNNAANPISSVEVTASVTGMPDIVKTFEFTSIPFAGRTILTLEGVKAKEATFVDFSLQLTKVNGVPFEGAILKSTVPAYDGGYAKKVVVEDATGTWCGWCPGGIEAIEYMKKTYPEKTIAIGVHSGDLMEIAEYGPYIQAYVSGYPNLTFNRWLSQTPTNPYTTVCGEIDEIVAYFDYPAYGEVALAGMSSADGSSASVKATASFCLSTSVPHLLSFVVVEDGVGPYPQTNYFRSQRVPMNGWQTKEEEVLTVFNDVARYYECFPGIAGSIPSEIECGKANEFSIDLPLSNVTGNAYRVIAMLTNAMTGEIVNGAQIDLMKDNGASVDGIESEDAAPAEYYNLNGVKVAAPTQGIYIRRQGARTEKVIIR